MPIHLIQFKTDEILADGARMSTCDMFVNFCAPKSTKDIIFSRVQYSISDEPIDANILESTIALMGSSMLMKFFRDSNYVSLHHEDGEKVRMNNWLFDNEGKFIYLKTPY